MSLIPKFICFLYRNDRKKMTNICFNFVKSFQEIIDEQGLTNKSNLFEIYFFIMFIVIRTYFRKRGKMIAECQVNLFIKEIFYYIWVNYIEYNRKVASEMFDLSTFSLVEKMNIGYLLKEMSLDDALEEMDMENIFEIFTNKLTDRFEFYSYSILSDINDKLYKNTINTLFDLTFCYKLNDIDRELLGYRWSEIIILNSIAITEKTI